jgi:hypothetical protein
VSSGETCDSGPGSAQPCPLKSTCVAGNCETATFTGDASRCTSSCTITQNDTNQCGGCSPAPGRLGEVCYPNGPSDTTCQGTYQCLQSTLEVYCLAFC